MPGRSRDDGLPIGSGPPGNGHALRHGLHRFLRSGELPPGCDGIAVEREQYRDRLSAAVQDRHGDISHTRAEIISAAETHFVCGRLLERWLCEPGLNVEQRAGLVRDIGRFADKRVDRVVQLDLDSSAAMDIGEILADVHREQAAQRAATSDGNGQHESEAKPSGSDATASEFDGVQHSGESLMATTEGGAV